MAILYGDACQLSRRAFAWVLAGAALFRRGTAAEAASGDRLAWSAAEEKGSAFRRRYRADAQVLVLGLTILHREGVGGGSVLWRELETADATRLLEFNGYSDPARAAGLNRLGFIRELTRTPANAAAESLYFGMMTASPEESAEQARKALHSGAKEQTYTAIEGRIGGGETQTTVAHFTAPAAMSGAHSAELADRARHALDAAPKVIDNHLTRAGSQCFLQTLAGMLARRETDGRYIYAGRAYRIHLTRSADPKAAQSFRERGLLSGAAEAIRISGKLQRELGGKETEFRLWIAGGSERPLPLRIEYRAKSYLRLTFEALAS